MTDEEIVKAFEQCGTGKCPSDCAYRKDEIRCDAKTLHKDILDLIRRLQYGYSSASKASDEWRAKYEKERNENAEQKAEIERLKGFLQTFETVIKEKDEQIEKRLEEVYADFMKEYKIAKQDLKESLEREVELQMQVDEIKSDTSKAIENYKKEMSTAIKEAEKEIEEMQQQAVKDTTKKISKELFEKHTETYNKYVFKNSDYDDVETNAIINFSDSLYFEITKYFKERFGVEME